MEPRHSQIPGAGAIGQNAWLKGGSHGCKSGKAGREQGRNIPPPPAPPPPTALSHLQPLSPSDQTNQETSRKEAWKVESEELASWEQREGQRLE